MPPVPRFERVPPELDFPKEEREILRFWKERAHLREDAGASPRRAAPSSSTRGRPTANGLPHNGHVLTRVIKDVFPRYKTMRGWSVPAQGRLGHARPAGRGRGREGAAHPRQGGHRGVRRRAVHQEVHRVGLPVHEGVGGADRARRLLGRPRRRVRHLPPLVRRERVVGARPSCTRRGCSTRGTRSSGGGRRAGRRSARARWGRGTRRSTTRACTSRSRVVGEDNLVAPRVDDDPVDPAVEHVRRGQPELRLRRRRADEGRASLRPREGAGRGARRRSSGALDVERSCKGTDLVGSRTARRSSSSRRSAAASRTSSGASSPPTSSRSTPAPASSTSRPRSARTTTRPTADAPRAARTCRSSAR